MLAQAEHGSGYERVWLVTTSERVLGATQVEIQNQIGSLERREFVQRALQNGGVCVLAKDMKQAIAITNQFAPEHCELMTKNTTKVIAGDQDSGRDLSRAVDADGRG